jgi:hypothetical protein
MNTALRTAPHYFVIEYIDQWIHTTHEYYSGLCDELGVDIKHIKVIHDECKHGGWHRICFAPDHFSPELAEHMDFESAHTLFIQVYDGVMLGDGVVVYDQMNDMVRTITHKHTAMRMAEEGISLEAERIKRYMHTDKERGYDLKYAMNSLCFCYDSLAEVVRDLEYPQDVMVDIDDSCTHYFPIQAMKQMVYADCTRITTA